MLDGFIDKIGSVFMRSCTKSIFFDNMKIKSKITYQKHILSKAQQ